MSLTLRRTLEDGSWAEPLRPTILRSTWNEIRSPMPWAAAFVHIGSRLSLIASREWYPHDAEHFYQHISLAGRSRLPTWDELVEAKEAFLGTDVEALQVLPRRRDWLNAHEYCLHLWSREGAPFLEEITKA